MIVIRNNNLRTFLKWFLPFFAIPLVVLAGATVFNDKSYAFITLVVTILALVLFISGFEKRKTGTRRLIIVSVMTALSVTGRFIPLTKPVTALTVITAVYLGGESGFLVGGLSALISNFYFGQGPWTPFQMLSWGLIGLIAGLIAPLLSKNRLLLIIYGLLSGVVYSFIMDIWTVLWYNGGFDITLYAAALTTAIPYTVLYALSNAGFLWLFAKPFGEKLSRVKLKYGV